MNPKFITFEGPEGSGKTSVIKAIVEVLTSKNIDILTTREPGGIKISEQIRGIILDVDNTEMDARTEALLYAAARRQHIAEKIMPALNKGQHILCDRYVDSSLAYQGYGRGLGIDEVYHLNQFAIESLLPDLTIFIDVPPSIGLKRVFSNGRKVDRLDLETITFHEKVYQGYKEVINKFPKRIKVIDGTKPIETVIEEALKLILSIL
ncbi:MAG: dTMP kinase [Candidatus Izemoplasmataceae bacterium]